MPIQLRVISLGAGVQSTTMALMAAKGEIGPMPDCAIFADTQSEPTAVYEHLGWLRSAAMLPFPIHVVTTGSLYADLARGTNSGGRKRYAAIPVFLDKADGDIGMGRRQCTSEYKLKPLLKKQRELLGYAPRQRIPHTSVEVWIGISLDEAVRMKPAHEKWQVNRWPLVEARMNRNDCLRWLEQNGYPTPPKSACTFCPFRSDASWRELRKTDQLGWLQAVELDNKIRGDSRYEQDLKAIPYLHRSLKPLGQVDLSTAEDHGQLNLFNNECEGMCGV